MAIMLKSLSRCFSAKIYESSIEAVSDIRSGTSIAIGGYMTAGVPEHLIKALKDYGNYDFTIVTMGSSLENYGINTLVNNKQVKRLVTPFVGKSPVVQSQYLNGDLELELIPNGTLAEKIRAAGAGIPGFWTTTGVGTIVEEGGFITKYKKGGKGILGFTDAKEKRIFNGREHLYEEAIRTEYSIIKAWKADTLGNLVYRRTARNFNPEMATCSKITIAEVEEIVPIGSLDPDEIDTPSIFVHRIFKGDKYVKPVVNQVTKQGTFGESITHRDTDLRIAKRLAQELRPGMYVRLNFGIPNLAVQYLEKGVIVASASGIIGMGPRANNPDPDTIDANGEYAWIAEGGAVVSTNCVMDYLRGGHFDASVVGAFEVSKNGDLANWLVPGVYVRGIGSSMDCIANKDTRLIVAMNHTYKGKPKIVDECSLPLTGKKCVHLLITELGVFDFRENGLNLKEIAKGVTLEEIRSKTSCGFTVSSDVIDLNYK